MIKLQNESRVFPDFTVPPEQTSFLLFKKLQKYNLYKKKAQKESAFYDFDIKGLDNYFEENKFKRFCMRNG